MKRRVVSAFVLVTVVLIAAGIVFWLSLPGLAATVESHGGRVIDEPDTPEGPTVSVVFTARPIADADLGCLRGRTGFQRLFLDSTRVQGDCLENLATARDLRWLSLGHCPIGDDGLKHLPALPELELLNLNFTRVTDAGLARVRICKNLRRLFLSRTAITDAGLEHLRDLNGLIELDVSSTRVTGSGVRHLQDAIPSLTKVQYGEPED
jgi:Leucine Rich repeat